MPSYPSAVTGAVLCIRSIHNRKFTVLHTPVRFFLDLSRAILTHDSLKTSFITGTLNFNNKDASVINYSSNIFDKTESSSDGDLLKADEV